MVPPADEIEWWIAYHESGHVAGRFPGARKRATIPVSTDEGDLCLMMSAAARRNRF